jgi:hypothetical protein
MSKEEPKTGEDQTGAADLQTTGVKDAGAAGQQTTGEQDIPAAGEAKDVEGLKAAAIDERKKRQEAEARAAAAEAQAKYLAEQAALMQANKPQQAPQDAFAAMGLDDNDYPNVEQQRKVFAMQAQQQQVVTALNQFISTHPDFVTTVGTINPATGKLQPSEQLNKAIANRPDLIAECSGPYGLINAYNAVKLDLLQQQRQQEAQQTETEKIEDKILNAERVGALSSTGGTAVVNRKSQVWGMSKKEFDEYDRQIAAKRPGT